MDSGETAWLLICREWAFLSQKEYEISGLHGVACRLLAMWLWHFEEYDMQVSWWLSYRKKIGYGSWR